MTAYPRKGDMVSTRKITEKGHDAANLHYEHIHPDHLHELTFTEKVHLPNFALEGSMDD